MSGTWDRSLHVWDMRTSGTGQCEHTLTGHNGPVDCVVELGDERVVSGSWDRSLRVGDMRTGQCQHILRAHNRFVKCVVELGDGRVVSGGEVGLCVWG